MRIGTNPEKENNQLTYESYHRVVIPVYIPNLEEDYFKDGLKIFELCIKSLLKTVHSKTRISLIDNGCCNEASDYLQQLFNTHPEIDQLLKSKINLGKVNAIYSAVKSNLEPLITISDADVMFLDNWQTEVEQVFRSFPEAGMVSPVPSSIAYRGKHLNSTIYYALFKGKLDFKTVEDRNGLEKFQESVGRTMYNENHLSKYLVVSNRRGEAVIGCGHFVATLRAQVFEKSPKGPSRLKIVGGSENKYIDIPNDQSGFLRLATKNNLAYHLGNSYEEWMNDTMRQITRNEKESYLSTEELNNVQSINGIKIRIGAILHKILFRKFKRQYFQIKGIKGDY
ncbi:glycosyltransferase family A protein [Winogradskyella sp.]|uniref:glycosyltransferase family A protein n=1 Tax=Winogradskyella sp. TaxID=1883156 RepID=UPI00261F6761|nr:glycosyltransferase family A protein [Winogradskyella sp.]